MASSSSSPIPPASGPECSLCKSPIAPGAIKCVACEGYQGRWFFLNLSAPVLSLLVALVSILSLAVPAVVASLSRPSSQVVAAFQYFEDGVAYLVVSNSGSRPGSIGEVYLDYGQQGWRYGLSAGSDTRYVAPGASRQMKFRLACRRDDFASIQYAQDRDWGSRPIPKDARLNIVTVQFDGTSETISVPIGALSGVQVIADRMHQCVQESLKAKSTNPPPPAPAP